MLDSGNGAHEEAFLDGNAPDVPKSTAADYAASTSHAITIADAHLLFHADFKRSGSDLKLIGADGKLHTVSDYFKSEHLATLLSPDGAALSGEIVAALAGPLAPGKYAAAEAPQAIARPIGHVAKIEGHASVVRNGVKIELNAGDVVLKSDVVETAGDGILALIFNDGSAFQINQDSRLVLSEFSYDPRGSDSAEVFNLVQGSFSFVSGKIAERGAMKIGTPVATMKIDGTAGGGDIGSNNGQVTLYIYQQTDGEHKATVLDQNGNSIATISSIGGKLLLTPTGPSQFSTSEQNKTDADKAAELDALRNILAIKNLGDQFVNALTTAAGGHGSSFLPLGVNDQGSPGGQPDGFKTTPVTIFVPQDNAGAGGGTGQAQNNTTTDPVNTPDRAPVANADNYTMNEDGVLVVAPAGVLANDSDLDGDALTAVLEQGPQHGNLTLNGEGSFVYTPFENYNGTDSFTYHASGGGQNSAPATVRVVVNPVNDEPIITGGITSGTVIEAGDLQPSVIEAGPGNALRISATVAAAAAPTLAELDEHIPLPAPGSVVVTQANIRTAITDVMSAAGVGKDTAIAVVWKNLDGLYGSHGPNDVNLNAAFLYLGLEYAAYVKDGGSPLVDVVAKYNVDGSDWDTVPDRVQALHDNLLGNLTDYALHQRYGTGALYDEMHDLVSAQDASLLTRTVQAVGGYETDPAGSTAADGHAYDLSHGYASQVSGQLTASDVDGDSLKWSISGTADGTYGTIAIDPVTGLWTYTLDDTRPATQGLGSGAAVTDTFVAMVSDGHGGSASQTVEITVLGTNDAPTVVVNDSFSQMPRDLNAVESTAPLQIQDHGQVGYSYSDVDLGDSVALDGDALQQDGWSPGGGGWTKQTTYGDIYIVYQPAMHMQYVEYVVRDALREQQVITEDVVVRVIDSHGAQGSMTLTFTATGTNDAPIVTTQTDATVGEAAGDSSAQDIDGVTGTVTVNDLDLGDTLRGSVVGDATADYNHTGSVPNGFDVSALIASGAITFDEAISDGGDKTLTWTYDPAAADLDWLNAGDTLTITYQTVIADGTTTVTQPITITITGTNDDPVVTAQPTGNGYSAIEGSTTADALIIFSDADLGDTVSFDSQALQRDGWVGMFVPPLGAEYTKQTAYGMLTLYDLNNVPRALSFAPNDALRDGQVITEIVALPVVDTRGGHGSTTVTFTITGTNDEPIITDVSGVTVFESPDASAQDIDGTAGTLIVRDLDIGDTLEASVTGNATALYDGAAVPPEHQAGFAALLASGAISFEHPSTTSTGGDITLNWTYDPGAANLDWLANGTTLTITYQAQVTDGMATVTRPITITIVGTNDAPIITSGAGASVAENTLATTTVYQIVATDVDNPSLTFSLSGVDAALFDVSSTTGAVTFKAPPDFEAPNDADHDNVYNIVVHANDGSADVSRAVAITITDVAENHAPVIVATAAPQGTVTEDASFATAGSNILTNGGFETGDFTGWTPTGTMFVQANQGQPEGTYLLQAGWYSSNQSITQVVTTVAGEQYTLSYWLMSGYNENPNNRVTVLWNGEVIATNLNVPNYNVEYTKEVVGLAGQSTFQFLFSNQQTFVYIDDISLIPQGGVEAANGVVTFTDADAGDHHTATYVAQGGGVGYIGAFSLDASVTESNGSGTVGWHFAASDADLQSLGAGQIVKQYYDVTIKDDASPSGITTTTVEVDLVGVNDAPTGTVTISGTRAVGSMLTALDTLADADGLGTLHYKWQKGTGGTWTDIGADLATYTLTAGDLNNDIRVIVSYNDGYTDESVTSVSVPFTLNHAPVLSQPVAPGETLTKNSSDDISSRAKALALDGHFGLGVDSDIALATAIPHVSINATSGNGTLDYYKFTVTAGSRGIFDIDGGYDSVIRLVNSSGVAIASNDDDPDYTHGAGGSSPNSGNITYDSYLDYTFAAGGTYYLVVGFYNGGVTSGGQYVPANNSGGSYQLQISLENAVGNTANVALETEPNNIGAPVNGVTTGTLISSIVDRPGGGGYDNVTDADASDNIGIALTRVDTSHGNWWYSTDSGAHWTAINASTLNTKALLLSGSSQLYFQPTDSFVGTINSAITFRAWDQSDGTAAGTLVTISSTGGTTPFSTATANGDITIDVPFVVNNDTISGGSGTPPGGGWTEYGGHYYKVVVSGSTITWSDASAAAQAVGGYLATIGSVGENSTIQGLLMSASIYAAAWLGGSDAAAEGSWVWTGGPEANQLFWTGSANGSAPGGIYENWQGIEPNGGTDENYTVMYGSDGLWYDYSNTGGGNAPYAYVLEYSVLANPTEDTITTIAASTLLANDTGAGLQITGVTDSVNGAAVTLVNGVISYDPTHATAIQDLNGGDTLVDTFTYTVTDAYGNTKTATVSVNVTGLNEPPTITSAPTATLAENDTSFVYQITATNPGAGAVTYSLSGADAALFDISPTGAVTFKEPPNFEGPLDAGQNNVYDIVIHANNGVDAQQAVQISVTNVNEAPVVANEPYAVGIGYIVTPPAGTSSVYNTQSTVLPATLFSDPEGATLTWSASNLPVGFSFDGNSRTLSFASTVVTGIYDVTISAGDGQYTASQVVKVWVAGSTTSAVNANGGSGNDTIIGGSSGTTYTAGSGNDFVDAGGGADTISGGDGNDVLYGSTNGTFNSFDTINGGNDNDYINGGANNDKLFGDAGNDWLVGEDGNDQLTGGADNDTLLGGSGNDTFYYTVGDGTDRVYGGTGTDTFAISGTVSNDTVGVVVSGGVITQLPGGTTLQEVENITLDLTQGGSDLLSYAATTESISVNLAAGTATGFTSIAGVENVTGGSGNDTLTGDFNANVIDGGAGDDTINYIIGGGADTIIGGTNTAVGDTLVISGTTSDESLVVVVNGSGTITSVAGGGVTGVENVTLDMGDGTDTLSYAGTASGVSVNATVGGSATGFAGNIVGVENLAGGDGNDTLTGDSGNNTLSGGNGNDILIGGAGRDTLMGGGNNDTFVVNAAVGSSSDSGRVTVPNNNNDTGQDSITDFDFTNDTIQVVATNVSNFTHGTDTFVGTATGNKNDGSAGSFLKTVGLVNLSHDASTQVIGNGDVAITFASNVTESSFEARIKYDLMGTGNNDTITTGALNDKLTGGAGADTLTGGGGADTFVFTNLTDSLVASSSRDTIMDFVSGTDFLQIGHTLNGFTDLTGSAIAGSGNLANDILSLLNSGNLAANGAAEVKIAGSSYVVINDGTAGFNSASDAVIKLNNNAVLHVGDFIV